MRAILPLVLGFLLTLRCFAGASASIDGMSGVPLGSGTAQAMAVMDERGAHFFKSRSTSSHLYYEEGSFENRSVAAWHFDYSDGKLYKTEVALHPAKDKLKDFAELKKSLAEKYGDPVQETKIKMDDAELLPMIAGGKLDLTANWFDSASGLSIECKLALNPAHVVLLRITYKDDKVAGEVAEKEKGDL